jgi:hypothetical protein
MRDIILGSLQMFWWAALLLCVFRIKVVEDYGLSGVGGGVEGVVGMIVILIAI